MKKTKLILALSLIIPFTSVCKAEMVLHNAKLLSSETTFSPGHSGRFEETNKTYAQKKTAQDTASASAEVDDFSANEGEAINLWSEHGYNITNSSSQAEEYTIEYKLTCDDGGEADHVDHVEVQPGGDVSDDARVYLTEDDDSAGTFGLHAETHVSGDATASDYANGTLSVEQSIFKK